MPKARLDLEKDKFDSEGRVKVSIENVNTTGSDQDVIVKNTSSEPVPVSIVNPDDNIDIQVEIQPNITIDDSTPIDVNVTNTSVDVNITALDGDGDLGVKIQNTNDIDVNVTNASVNTNATIQNANIDVNLTDLDVNNRLPVSVDNQPTVTVDSSTPVDVNVTNTVATNATIQNAELDVNVTNPFQYVYDMVYDGSQWRFQLSDSNGKAINLDRTYYTSSDITTMGASSDINVWLAAYNDSMLTKKYVATWDAEYEQDVYLQHPSLSSGNCLHLIYQYTTQNSVKVLESVWAKIDTWSYDDEIAGTVSITAGTVTSPAVDAAAGTDVCTLTATNNSIGDIVVSLSGTNASLYQLNDGVTTGSSITNPSTPLVLELASTLSGASYSHSVTATITGSTFSVTDSVTIETSGTATAPSSFSNLKYVSSTYRGYASSSSYEYGRYYNSGNEGLWPSLEDQTLFRDVTNGHTLSFYMKRPSSISGLPCIFSEIYNNSASYQDYFGIYLTGQNIVFYNASNNQRVYKSLDLVTEGISIGDWFHLVLSCPATQDELTKSDIYINGSSATLSSLTGDTAQNMVGSDFYVTAVNIGGTLPNRSGYTDTYSGANAGSGDFDIDELTSWSKALSSSEVSELYNSATVIDPTTHSASANLERHLRFGDNANDGANIYDDQDVTWYLTENTSTDNTTSLTSSDDIYVPASGAWANDYYARSNTTTSSVVDYRINGTEKSLFPNLSTGTNTFPPMTTAWSMSFWLYMPSTGTTLSNSNRECLFKQQVGSAQGGIQVFMRGTNTLECYITGTTTNNYIGSNIGSGFNFNAWNLITINYDGNYQIDIHADDNNSAGSYISSGNTSTINTQLSNATINATEIMSFVHTPAGGSTIARANRFYRIDELTTYNRELTTSEIQELYNNGTTLNPDDLSFSSTVISYFRFGDGSNDSTTNYYSYDENDSNRYFEPITAGTRDFTAY